MSHHGFNTFYYDPILFGHPHELAKPTPTEPFWHQYPSWTSPNPQLDNDLHYSTFFYPATTSTAMDSETVYIGSKTKNGKRVQSPTQNNSNRPYYNQANKSVDMVDVYIDNEYILKMPLKVLVRFSKAAAAAFPKPEAVKKVDKTDDTAGAGALHEWAEEDDNDLDVEKLTAEVSKLSTESRGQVVTHEAKKGSALPTPPSSNSKETKQVVKKELHLHLDTLWIQPPKSAFEFAFHWMHEAKGARHGDPVLEYGVPRPEALSLQRLVDLYAAALCLGVRPFPHKTRHAVMNRVTTVRPLVGDLKYVHERLPIDDPVMTRLITSCFEHKAPRSGAYDDTDLKLIDDYVCEVDEDLHGRFKQIGKARAQRYEEEKREHGGARMQQIAEGGTGPTAPQQPAVNGVGQGEGKTEGRRRNRRTQDKKTKESNGDAASSA